MVLSLTRRYAFWAIFSASGALLFIGLLRFYKRYSTRTVRQSKNERRRPTRSVDPRYPYPSSRYSNSLSGDSGSGTPSFRYGSMPLRPISEEDRQQVRHRRRSKLSTSSSIDRHSITSVRSTKTERTIVQESIQPLAELNLDYYSDVLARFEIDLQNQLKNKSGDVPSQCKRPGTTQKAASAVQYSTQLDHEELMTKLQSLLDLAGQLNAKEPPAEDSEQYLATFDRDLQDMSTPQGKTRAADSEESSDDDLSFCSANDDLEADDEISGGYGGNGSTTYQSFMSVTSPPSGGGPDLFLSPMSPASPVPARVMSPQLALYEEGLLAVSEDLVPCRVLRTELLGLGSDAEFLAKLYGIRKAMPVLLDDPDKREFLLTSGRRLVSQLLICCSRDASDFEVAFDNLVEFCSIPDNWSSVIEDELTHRGVVDMNFFDIVIDFIFLDAFDDLEQPPSSILAVLQNRWLSSSFKETALRTAVWSVLKAKRARLRHPDGFINKFYCISEVISPLFAYGFLGPPGDLQDLLLFFKEEVLGCVRSMFDVNKVRYVSELTLAEDIMALCQRHLATIFQRLDQVPPL